MCRANGFCHRQRDDKHSVAIRDSPEGGIHRSRELELAVIATSAPLVENYLLDLLPLLAGPHFLITVSINCHLDIKQLCPQHAVRPTLENQMSRLGHLDIEVRWS